MILQIQASCKLTDTTTFLTLNTGLTQTFSIQQRLILCYFVWAWYFCFLWQTRSVQLSGLNLSNLAAVFLWVWESEAHQLSCGCRCNSGQRRGTTLKSHLSKLQLWVVISTRKHKQKFSLLLVFFVRVGLVKDYILIST